jgi:hypothetical protein
MTTTSSLARSARRRAPALLGVALFALVIAACGSSSPTASTSSTTAPGASAGATTTSTAPAGGTSLSSKIGALSSQVQAAEKITFKAVYTTTGSGSNGSVTIEQAPPKSAFSSSGGSEINTGTASYFCSNANGQTTCYSAGASNPLSALTALFSPATALTELKAAQAEAVAHAAG